MSPRVGVADITLLIERHRTEQAGAGPALAIRAIGNERQADTIFRHFAATAIPADGRQARQFSCEQSRRTVIAAISEIVVVNIDAELPEISLFSCSCQIGDRAAPLVDRR